ncbi:MAG: hypothetical protein KC910_28720 [Candidatus Eremiobacteraeota bacterium]|nr:hypothetical protein [Candidatus Eremiobacteraeota bacterium]
MRIPVVHHANLAGAARGLLGPNPAYDQARQEVASAQAALDRFDATHPLTLEDCIKSERSKAMSNYGLFIICGSWMGGMFLSSKIGGTAGLITLGLSLAPIPAAGFYLMNQSAKSKAQTTLSVQDSERKSIEARLTQAREKCDRLLHQFASQELDSDQLVDQILDEPDSVEIKSFQLAKHQ